jgi:hemerythrin-like domain-containing protein
MYVINNQMVSITKVLVMEHAIYNDVFDQIERLLSTPKSTAEVKTLASFVEGLLNTHGETETNMAYSALDQALADRGALNRLYQDHHEIDDHLKRVHQTEDPVEARRLLKIALAVTREHFRREEKTVFPLLENTLQSETLTALGSKWTESHALPR